MARRIVLGYIIYLLICMSGGSLVAQVKLGYVDSQRVLNSYPQVSDVKKQLESENEKWGQELQRMQKELQDLIDQLNKQGLVLSDMKRKEKEQQIREKDSEIQQYRIQKWGQNGEYFKLQNKLLKPIYDSINGIIQRIGMDQGYDFIFDASGGYVLFARDKHDLTDIVIQELKKKQSSTKKE